MSHIDHPGLEAKYLTEYMRAEHLQGELDDALMRLADKCRICNVIEADNRTLRARVQALEAQRRMYGMKPDN